MIWQQFEPYHYARLRMSTERFRAEGAQLLGIEIEVTERHGIHRSQGSGRNELPILTLFPSLQSESPSRRRVFRAVGEALDRIDPDAVAVPAYSTPAAQAGLMWARDRRRVAVVMTESGRNDAVRLAARERPKRAVVSHFDAALAGGTPQARYIHELGLPANRIFIPYDVVDNDFFARGASAARSNPERFRYLPGLDTTAPFFLASGRFIERKNFATLIRAYAEYAARNQTDHVWELVILGDGPQRPSVSALARNLVRRGRVTFAGYRGAQEVAAYYGLAGAFVHPATVDQWGLVVNEAMAAGLPVLVSRTIGAVEDLVRHGVNGYTFDPDAPSAIAETLRRITAPGADLPAMGRGSRELVQGWSLERFAEGLWCAVMAGIGSSQRGMSLPVRLLIRANQIVPARALRWRSVEP